MNYAFAREVVSLDSLGRGSPVTIELSPAFAHLRPPETWTARVRITCLAAEPVRLLSGSAAVVALDPGATISVPLPGAAPTLAPPQGFRPLLRATAGPPGAVPAARQGPW